MAAKTDCKQKYFELRSKYMNAVDVAFRLGMQEGQRESEMKMLQQQLQEAQMAAEQAAMGGMPGEELPPEEMPPEEAVMEEGLPPEEMPPEEMAEGDALDESIDELEGLVSKNEKEFDFTSILKKFHQYSANNSLQKDEEKDKKSNKINQILKKWDDEDQEIDIDEDGSEETDEEDVIGQA